MTPPHVTVVRLIKAHALGNDFLLLDATAVAPPADLAGTARRVCDRHRGIGADGLLVFTSTTEGARSRLLNADGSPSELSGNGVRCLAAWLAESRVVPPGASIAIETDAGPKSLELLATDGLRRTFRASMGRPADLRQVELDVGESRVAAVVLRVGNPQCVVLGPATADRLSTLAARLAVHPYFPEGTNVELATVEAPDRVRMLIWERGVGPTEASGTGACAAAVAAAAFGGANRACDVIAPGGTQRVQWTNDDILLTGWAEIIGEVDWWMNPA
jgi:diaminopimelate epimerase